MAASNDSNFNPISCDNFDRFDAGSQVWRVMSRGQARPAVREPVQVPKRRQVRPCHRGLQMSTWMDGKLLQYFNLLCVYSVASKIATSFF